MPRPTYGDQVRERVQHLLAAILAYANDELEDETLRSQLETRWQTETQLVIKTKLRVLGAVCHQHGQKLSKEQIREALNRLKDYVGILQDHRIHPKGAEDWYFTLNLWSKNTTTNLKKLEEVWEKNRLNQKTVNFVAPAEAIPFLSKVKPHLDQRQLYSNLPAKSYSEFIGRRTELKQLLKFLSLNYRTPIITVDGIGGVGKTALVLEAVYQCLHAKQHSNSNPDIPLFDAIIFTSAKQNYLLPTGILPRLEQHRTLGDIFRAIADTLEAPTITQGGLGDSIRSIYDILSRQETLLIIDNLETLSLEIQDEILGFLCDLPPSTKAVITTRKRRFVYAAIRLDSLSPFESETLIKQQAQEKGMTLTPEQIGALVQRLGGVPSALIYIIGQFANGYNLERILNNSNPLPEDIAYFCFEGSVSPLRDKPAHKLLMALAIFTAPPVQNALIEVAQLTRFPQSTVEDSLAELYQLSLITPQQGRYQILSLTREYAKAELATYSLFEQQARERWVEWYKQFTKTHGQKDWGEWHLQCDHLQEEWENLLGVLYWCASVNRYEDVRDLWLSLNDFTYLYGYWEERNFWLDWLIQASEQQGDWATLADILSHRSFLLIRQGREDHLQVAEQLLQRAWELRQYADLRRQQRIAQDIALLRLAQQRYEEAHDWLGKTKTIIHREDYEEKWHERDLINATYCEGQIFFKQTDLQQAAQAFEGVIRQADKKGWLRAINYAQNWLAEVRITQGHLEVAEKLLKLGLPVAERNKDQRRIACYQAAFARLEKARWNLEASSAWGIQAMERFKRLGMQQEYEELEGILNG